MVVANQDLMEVHRRDFRTSERLSRYFFMTHRRGEMMVLPDKVLKVLYEAKVKFVLMGTHGVAAWRKEPRATEDIDILVAKRNLARALTAIRKAFPKLVEVEGKVVVRFFNPDTNEPVIDLMKPVQEIFRLALRHSIAVDEYQRIPTLEMALASKFAAMVSPNRRAEKKHIDAGDFMRMVRVNRDTIDVEKLKDLCNTVYRGASKDVMKLIADIEAGKTIRV